MPPLLQQLDECFMRLLLPLVPHGVQETRNRVVSGGHCV